MEAITPVGRASVGASAPSAVAWGAIVAGAVAAIAASIVLLTLGTGLGLTAVSPWGGEGISAKSVGVAAVVWMVIVQWLSAGLGGYLTGRLRTRWIQFHQDEVYFRDTAHGFLAWALAIGIITLAATSMTTSILGGAAKGAASGAAQVASSNDAAGYFTDSLYRSDMPSQGASNEDVRGETSRILAQGVGGDLAPTDRAYLSRLVAARTGLSADDAQKRVDEVITKSKQAADAARKAAASLAIATALSLAIGAFIAAVAAGIGGHERDD
jgi:hypothetical protein